MNGYYKKIKKSGLVLLIMCLLLILNNYYGLTDPLYVWTKRIGGPGDDIGADIAVDSTGNIFIMGGFANTVDFGADFGTSDSKTSTGGECDIFITKIKNDGSYGWTKTIAIEGDEGCGVNIVTDPSDNIFIVGTFTNSSVDFGADFGTSDSKTFTNEYNVFITKIKNNGSYEWTKTIGGPGNAFSISATVDSSGNLFITGGFSSNVNFGADFGINDIKTSTGGECDIFITKIKNDGSYDWTKTISGTNFEIAHNITIDNSENIYITGYFNGIVDFGTNFGVSDKKISTGTNNIFITKINSDSSYGWTRIIKASFWEDIYVNIVSDGNNILILGKFKNTVDFGADFGTSDSKTSAGDWNTFITKIKNDGSYEWTKRIGDTDEVGSVGITADSSGNIFITGLFSSTVNFGADFGINDTKTSVGNMDIFITKIKNDGSYDWTKTIGGPEADGGLSVTVDSSDNLFITGLFSSTVNFGADFGINDVKSSAGSCDIFITKIMKDDETIKDEVEEGDAVIIGDSETEGTINPDKGNEVKIYFKSSRSGKFICRIFTISGKLIYETTIDTSNEGYFSWIPDKDIASGVYIVHIEGPGINMYKKLAILK